MQPVLDQYLPSISIGPHTNYTLPVSEVISQYLGIGTLLSGYALYSTVNNGKLSLAMNAAFMLPAFMIMSGHGVHVACVTIQIQMAKQDPLYPLVYFLHEHWSHNTFLTGFYGLVFLLIWAERYGSGSKFSQNPAIKKQNQVHRLLSPQVPNGDHLKENLKLATTPKTRAAKSCQGTVLQECYKSAGCDESMETVSMATIDNHKHKNGTFNHYSSIIIRSNSNANGMRLTASQQCLPTSAGCITRTSDKMLRQQMADVRAGGKVGKNITEQGRQMTTMMARLIVFWTTWVMPIMMGVYFSVFASLTSTKPLTMLFYMGVLSIQMAMVHYYYHKEQIIILSFRGLSDFLKLWDSDEMIVGGCFTKAVLVGLPLMLVDFE